MSALSGFGQNLVSTNIPKGTFRVISCNFQRYFLFIVTLIAPVHKKLLNFFLLQCGTEQSPASKKYTVEQFILKRMHVKKPHNRIQTNRVKEGMSGCKRQHYNLVKIKYIIWEQWWFGRILQKQSHPKIESTPTSSACQSNLNSYLTPSVWQLKLSQNWVMTAIPRTGANQQ